MIDSVLITSLKYHWTKYTFEIPLNGYFWNNKQLQ